MLVIVQRKQLIGFITIIAFSQFCLEFSFQELACPSNGVHSYKIWKQNFYFRYELMEKQNTMLESRCHCIVSLSHSLYAIIASGEAQIPLRRAYRWFAGHTFLTFKRASIIILRGSEALAWIYDTRAGFITGHSITMPRQVSLYYIIWLFIPSQGKIYHSIDRKWQKIPHCIENVGFWSNAPLRKRHTCAVAPGHFLCSIYLKGIN